MLYLVIIVGIILVCYFVLKQAGFGSQPATFRPSVTVTVTREEVQRVPPPKVELDKLEGFERKRFEVVGVGEKTGRKRTKLVEAIDEDEARRIVAADGTVAHVITQLADEPASEAQKEYAKHLKIDFDESITLRQMSYLISAAVDTPATEYQMRVAQKHGVPFNKYSFKSTDYLNNAIRKHLGIESRAYYKEVAKSYVYSVCRFLNREKWEDPVHCRTSETKIDDIVDKIVSDERIMKSVLRQKESNPISVTYFDQGESRDTVAYNSIRELIINS